MEGPISFWGYKEQESNLILPEHDDDDDGDDDDDDDINNLETTKELRLFWKKYSRTDNKRKVRTSKTWNLACWS